MSGFTTRRIREGNSHVPPAPKRPSPTPISKPSIENAKSSASSVRIKLLKRLTVILLGILGIVLLLSGIVSALISLRVLSIGSFLQMTGSDLLKDNNGYTNVLLLGQGDKSHDGMDLTDTIMVASIDPRKTKSVVLISIPRDLYLMNTGKMGAGRINGMYRDYKYFLHRREEKPLGEASKLAMEELKNEVSKMLGQEIHYVVKVDFIGFVQAVDALGGVDIEVPYDIVDTQYPGSNYSYQTFAIRAGMQHLDGETALKYTRSRHTTSDFGRSARQQQLLAALASKAKEIGVLGNVSKATKLLKIISEHSETTMSVQELLGAAKMARDVESSNVISMQLNSSAGIDSGSEPGGFLFVPPREQFQGAFVLLPVDSTRGPLGGIQTFAKILFEERSFYLQNVPIHVLNAGARNSLASVLGGELIRYGFAIENIDNASIEDSAASWVSPGREEDQKAAEFLSELLKLPVEPLPAGLEPGEAAQLTIFLGEEYEHTPLPELVLPASQ